MGVDVETSLSGTCAEVDAALPEVHGCAVTDVDAASPCDLDVIYAGVLADDNSDVSDDIVAAVPGDLGDVDADILDDDDSGVLDDVATAFTGDFGGGFDESAPPIF